MLAVTSPYSLQACKQPSASYRPYHPCFIFASIDGHCPLSSSHGMVTQQQLSELAQPLGSSASSTHEHYNAGFAHCPSLPPGQERKKARLKPPLSDPWVVMALRCASPASVSAGTCYQKSNISECSVLRGTRVSADDVAYTQDPKWPVFRE